MRIGRTPEVLQITRFSRTSLWRRQRDPVDPFPPGIPLGPNTTGFDLDEVEAWLERKKAQRTSANTDHPNSKTPALA
jgi:predicted DNA-binding transcriptional regulator AlpA